MGKKRKKPDPEKEGWQVWSKESGAPESSKVLMAVYEPDARGKRLAYSYAGGAMDAGEDAWVVLHTDWLRDHERRMAVAREGKKPDPNGVYWSKAWHDSLVAIENACETAGIAVCIHEDMGDEAGLMEPMTTFSVTWGDDEPLDLRKPVGEQIMETIKARLADAAERCKKLEAKLARGRKR